MENVYLLIGGNLGNRESNMQKALNLISVSIGNVIKKSSIYQTAAWGNTNQPNFLNQVLVCETALNPQQVLTQIHIIETIFKRIKLEKWGSRTMDVDILFYNDCIIDTPNLKIPHPLLTERRFVMVPLYEIAPQLIHPILKTSITHLYNNCNDKLEVFKIGNEL